MTNIEQASSEKTTMTTPSDKESPRPSGDSFVPQFALDAADSKIAAWSTAMVEAADSIDRLLSSESLPVPDGVRELATSTTQRLRTFGTQSGERDAAELVAGLQRSAAAHPAASIGIGAAVGAALAALLVRVKADPAPTAETREGRDGRKT